MDHPIVSSHRPTPAAPHSRLGSHRGLLAVASGLLLGLAAAGCSEGEPAPKKVDVSAQIAALKGDNDAKAAALSELAAGGPNAAGAVKEIIPLLKSDDPVVRRLAAYALGQIGAPAKEAVPGLTAMLQDPDGNAVTAAINALRAIDPSKAPAENIPNVTQ